MLGISMMSPMNFIPFSFIFSIDSSMFATEIVTTAFSLGMLPMQKQERKTMEPLIVRSTHWVRSPGSGLCQIFKRIGAYVTRGDLIAEITDPYGTGQNYQVISPVEGVIISKNRLPLINTGEPILHIAKSKEEENASLDDWHAEVSNKPE